MFVGGFIHITVHVYVHALHFLFSPALCEALLLVYFGVTEVLSSGAVTDTRTVSLDCGNGRDFCTNAHGRVVCAGKNSAETNSARF